MIPQNGQTNNKRTTTNQNNDDDGDDATTTLRCVGSSKASRRRCVGRADRRWVSTVLVTQPYYDVEASTCYFDDAKEVGGWVDDVA